jgi:hypothetical protein
MSPGVKTQWHLAAAMTTEDPFANVVYSSGITLDLTASESELAQQWINLTKREENLFHRGLTCELKDHGQDCRVCPMATLDASEPRAVLCRIGKDQAAVEAAYHARVRERKEALEEFVAEIDLATELGHMPDDLAELAAAVGL